MYFLRGKCSKKKYKNKFNPKKNRGVLFFLGNFVPKIKIIKPL